MPERLPDVCRSGRQHRADGQACRAAHARTAPLRRDRTGAHRMTTLSDRLRGVIGGGLKVGSGSDLDSCASVPVRKNQDLTPDAVADVLDGQWHERDGQRFLVVDRTYVPGYRHGSMVLADGLPPSDGVWPRLSLLANSACGSQLLFVDLETTGIAGGAGTYAFLVGCAWFAGGTFRIRQFFLSDFAAERALLESVADVAGTAGTVVTYNGKSFDLPLIETRFALHRMPTPFAGLPHIDMLHPARRMWRRSEEPGRNGPADQLRRGYGGPPKRSAEAEAGHYVPGQSSSCRLSTLEQTLCGYVREGDVPGFEIPARYFRYVRSGDARPLEVVLEHNRLDLLSLALV